MATNKHAMIRYIALDKCFRNFNKKYFYPDLIEACNKAVFDYSGIDPGMSLRQIQYDIEYMESEAGWGAPIDRLFEGGRRYFRYSDKNFSINNKGINHAEAEQLRETLILLTRFEGMPQFEWIGEMKTRLGKAFSLSGDSYSAVYFDNNPYLKGMEFFTEVFHAIENEQVLDVDYQSYRRDEPVQMRIHPWFLKQYNNRWFLFGYNEEYDSLTNLALDRVVAINEANGEYIASNLENVNELFEDVVGVTLREDIETERVQLRIDRLKWPYIESKPLHGSQRVISENEDGVTVELELKMNHEFKSLIFSHMDGVEVLSPQGVRDEFKRIVEGLRHKYFT